MGVFDFIKNVGEKVFKNKQPEAPEVKQSIDKYNIGTDNVKVAVDGDKIVLNGDVKDQATYEKIILAAGNNDGVSQINADGLTINGQKPTDPVFYEVQPGDTLWKIAESQYGKGNGSKYNQIFEANKPMLSNPDKIYPGQKLRIPPMK